MRLTALLTVAVIACQMGTGWLAAAQDILPAEPAGVLALAVASADSAVACRQSLLCACHVVVA